MKQLGKDILVSVATGILLPGMILNYGAKVQQQTQREIAVQEKKEESSLPVRVCDEQGCVKEEKMDDYLVGVVLAEMPA